MQGQHVAVVAALFMAAAMLDPSAAAPQQQQDEEVSFSGHKVLRVLPASEEHVGVLRALLEERPTLDPWSDPRGPGEPVDIRVGPSDLQHLHDSLQRAGLQAREMIRDVGSLVAEEQRGMLDSKRENAEFGWDNYQALDDINKWLRGLEEKYPKEASVVEAGQSYEGLKILGLKLKFKEGAPIAFIEAGIHAREWVTPATATYLINDILTRNDTEFRDLVRSYEWHIFPSTNPDGYVYTHTTNRLWRKTRSRYNFVCYGADPNRNWPFHWREVGSGSVPCMDTYAGLKAESEPETQGLRRYLDAVHEKKRVRVYLSLHSYSQLLLFPWGWTNVKAKSHDQLNAVAAEAVQAVAKRYGTQYKYGSIATTIYPASGNTVDYAYSKGVSFPYAFELRDLGDYGFLLPKEQIKPTAEETVDAIAAIARGAMNKSLSGAVGA